MSRLQEQPIDRFSHEESEMRPRLEVVPSVWVTPTDPVADDSLDILPVTNEITPLTKTQRSWLNQLYSPEAIEHVDSLSQNQRLDVGAQLGQLYQNLKIYRVNEVDKAQRVTQLMLLLAGLSYVEIADRTGGTKQASTIRLKKIAESIGQKTVLSERDDTVSLDILPLSNIADGQMSLDDRVKIRQERIIMPGQETVKTVTKKAKPISTRDKYEDLDRLFKDILSDHTLLEAKQELQLAKRIEKGDLDAKDELINKNYKLVMDISKRYTAEAMTDMDIFQEGVLGLIRASEKYDWRKGYRFSTYATLWVRQSIRRGMDQKALTIRMPANVATKSREINRLEKEFEQKNGGQSPSIDDLSILSGVPVKDIEVIYRATAGMTSIDKPVNEDGTMTLNDVMASTDKPTDETVVDSVYASEMMKNIKLDALPTRTAKMIRMYFGLDGHSEMSLGEIAKLHGMTKKNTEYIVECGLENLRNDMRQQLQA